MKNARSIPREFHSLIQKLLEWSPAVAASCRAVNAAVLEADDVGITEDKSSGLIIAGPQGGDHRVIGSSGDRVIAKPKQAGPRLEVTVSPSDQRKSSGIIIGGTQGGGDHPSPPKPGGPGTPGDPVIGRSNAAGARLESAASHEPKLEALVLEERYAYYRRCQYLRKNGRQCKAPALKGEQLCYSHAAQIDARRRLEHERREFLARPGLGLGDANSIQRTLWELGSAILSGRISQRTWGRLLIECQTAIQLQKKFSTRRRSSALRKTGMP